MKCKNKAERVLIKIKEVRKMESVIWIKDDSENQEMDKMWMSENPLINFKCWLHRNETENEDEVLIRHPEELKFENRHYKYSEVKKMHLECMKKYFSKTLKEMYIGD